MTPTLVRRTLLLAACNGPGRAGLGAWLPPRIAWQLPPEVARFNEDYPDPLALQVCEQARQVIDAARLARPRCEGAAMDGHALLTRLKIAAALGLFDGRPEVDAEEWQLAEAVMNVSDRTRRTVAEELRRAAERDNEARGLAEATRARIVGRSTEADYIAKTAERIVKVLAKAADWITHSDLRRETHSRELKQTRRLAPRPAPQWLAWLSQVARTLVSGTARLA